MTDGAAWSVWQFQDGVATRLTHPHPPGQRVALYRALAPDRFVCSLLPAGAVGELHFETPPDAALAARVHFLHPVILTLPAAPVWDPARKAFLVPAPPAA